VIERVKTPEQRSMQRQLGKPNGKKTNQRKDQMDAWLMVERVDVGKERAKRRTKAVDGIVCPEERGGEEVRIVPLVISTTRVTFHTGQQKKTRANKGTLVAADAIGQIIK